jgi:glycosyltransferase involved in cell wall biosynthesis
MKIAFLHLTMGLVERGSEVVVDMLASVLAKSHEVMVIQAGPISSKSYQVKRVTPLTEAPSPAPRHLVDKLLFRLHVDYASGKVITFTQAAIPVLLEFAPDIIIAINGPRQLQILKDSDLSGKLVAFGHAGIGYHDRDTLSTSPDLFVALSAEAKNWAQQHARGATRVVHIPNPIDLARFRQSSAAKLTLSKPIVLTVGALSAYKNIESVISAVRLTRSSLLLIGDGEQSEAISRELSTLINNFLWIKQVDAEEIARYFQAANVFCLTPDSQEAFGMVYLEAMAAGLPIVASDDPVRRSLIGKQGIYVDPRSPEDIARGLVEAAKRGKMSYTQELKPYALKHVVNQLEAVLYDLIK